MKFIVLVGMKEGVDREQVVALQPDEVRVVWEMNRSGFLRTMNMRGDKRGMVAEVEATDIDEVKRQMATLPLDKAGLMEYQIIPLTPYTGYELLWKDK